jgi:hypothetical protein
MDQKPRTADQTTAKTTRGDAAADPSTSPEAGMRIYTAILGHEPTVGEDPDAESLATDAPSWRHLLEHAVQATASASRRLEEARKRLTDRAA